MTRGLTLGKFAPLHFGHQLLIEHALGAVDELVCIVYNAPEETSVPLSVRANWLRRLYPAMTVIEAWDGPTTVGYSAAIKKEHEDYLGSILEGLTIHVFFSAEPYGEHVSRHLGAANRVIDREQIPISASAIRTDPYAHRAYLDPLVYRDLVTNVTFVGAPSTGKTTLAHALAKRYNTAWMPEYGREYWSRHQVDKRLTPEQLLEIAREHVRQEEERLCQANGYLFTDTNAFTTAMFSRYYRQEPPQELRQLAADAEKRYDIWFFCRDDIPYEDTWDRSGPGRRARFSFEIEAELRARRIPYVSLAGPLEERISTVNRVLQNHRKFDTLAETLRRM